MTFIESWPHPHIVCLLGQIQKKFFLSPLSLSRRAHRLKSQMGLDPIRLSTLQDFVWEMIDWDVEFKTSEMTVLTLISIHCGPVNE